ncbi:MAG: protein translocase subunit SecD [bacterium]|nr:protein translocase subunit SecD [bacterium]
MQTKAQTYWILATLLLLGVVAFMVSFPVVANRAIERVNTGKDKISILKNLPSLPSLAETSFRLGLDLQGGIHLVYGADLSLIPSSEHDQAMHGLRDVIERRVNLFGITEPVVHTEGTGETQRLIVELAGVTEPGHAIEIIGQTPFLEFREPKKDYDEIVARNFEVFETGEGEVEEPFIQTLLTGRYLERAELVFDQAGRPTISLVFDREGATLFEEITSRTIGKPLAIYLDHQPLQAPIVQDVITGGKAQISGSYTVPEAQKLVRELNAGALPVPITLLSQQNVGATLGMSSLRQSLYAGVMGVLVLMIFMTAFYRLPGVFASVALLLYIVFLLFVLKFFSITLTLAGVAGIILSIGMAVDANVLIFSRMREELRAGMNFTQSMEEGFRRAWPSIRDGNITTLLVAFILFWFGSAFVKGFALTLSIGILLSMFSAIVITRSFLIVCVGTSLERISFLWGASSHKSA